MPDPVPSVKGFLFAPAVAQVKMLVKQGALSLDEVRKRLPEDDHPYLDEALAQVLWYPVASYGRIVELLWEAVAQRRPESLPRLGRMGCRHLLRTGNDPALQLSGRDPGDRAVKTVASALASVYNFMRWEVSEPQPGHFRISVHDCAEWPECLRLASEGFIREIFEASRACQVEVSNQRIARDEVQIDLHILDR